MHPVHLGQRIAARSAPGARLAGNARHIAQDPLRSTTVAIGPDTSTLVFWQVEGV
jgi:hypothetical protein